MCKTRGTSAPVHWVSVARVKTASPDARVAVEAFDIDDTVLFSSPDSGAETYSPARRYHRKIRPFGKNEQRLG